MLKHPKIIDIQNRYSRVKCGPVFCRQCGKFFEHKPMNVLDFDKCERHKNKIGFRLIDIL